MSASSEAVTSVACSPPVSRSTASRSSSARGAPDDSDLTAWSSATGIPIVSFADATAFGDTVILAVRGADHAVGGVLDGAGGPEAFAGKVVIDVTNPLVAGDDGPALESTEVSGGEALQERLPDAKVVKAFNTVGNTLMVDPQLPGGPPVMFIAGDDEDGVAVVGAILEAFGWRWLNVGGIERSRELEALCILWVAIGRRSGSWSHAFTAAAELAAWSDSVQVEPVHDDGRVAVGLGRHAQRDVAAAELVERPVGGQRAGDPQTGEVARERLRRLQVLVVADRLPRVELRSRRRADRSGAGGGGRGPSPGR